MPETDMLQTATPQPVRQPAAPTRRGRGYWLRQLHTWHWISSAVSLVGLLLFTLTGFTLNHAADIEARPQVVQAKAELDQAGRAALQPFADGQKAPIPPVVRRQADRLLHISVPDAPAEWSELEVYLAMPRPGGDAWISIDRQSGAMTYEATSRGWIAYLNDLHKGRDAGAAWRWFIDVFVLSAVVFIGTGFVLLWLHARHRPLTWPLTGLGLIIPLLLAIVFIH